MFEILSISSCIISIILIISCGIFLYRNIIVPIGRILSDPNQTIATATTNISNTITSNIPSVINNTKNLINKYLSNINIPVEKIVKFRLPSEEIIRFRPGTEEIQLR